MSSFVWPWSRYFCADISRSDHRLAETLYVAAGSCDGVRRPKIPGPCGTATRPGPADRGTRHAAPPRAPSSALEETFAACKETRLGRVAIGLHCSMGVYQQTELEGTNQVRVLHKQAWVPSSTH